MIRLIAAPTAALLLLSGCPTAECSAADASVHCVDQLPDGGDGGAGAGANCPDTSNADAPNLLANPGAECGTTGWFVPDVVGKGTIAVATEGAHAGANALVLTATGSGTDQSGPHVYNEQQVAAGPDETWCAKAFLRGGTAVNARLGIRHWAAGDTVLAEETYSIPLAPQWAMIPPTAGLLKLTTTRAETLQLRVILHDAVAGASVLIDDAQLWKSASGSCSER